MNTTCRSFMHPNEVVQMERLPNEPDSNNKPQAVWRCPKCGREKSQTLRSKRRKPSEGDTH